MVWTSRSKEFYNIWCPFIMYGAPYIILVKVELQD